MTNGTCNREAPTSAALACAQPPCRHAALRTEGNRSRTVELDYSPEFIDAICTDIENSRLRAARVLPAPADMPTMTPAQEIERRLGLYHQTGLRGYLVDVAKFAMQEWIACGEYKHHSPQIPKGALA
jgi:hypothetical protein